MKRRMTISIISVVCAVLLLCGWTAFASSSSGTAASASVTGTFKSISPNGAQMTVTTDKGEQTVPLAKSVWVYRNGQKAQLSDLKPGDRIEAIVNSKNQAAYVKASSEQAAAPAQQIEPPAPAPQQSNTPEPAPQQANPPAAAAPPANAGPTGSSPQANGIDPGSNDLELKVDGKHFKLRIEPNHGSGSARYELSLKPEDGGTVHLKGDEAAAWIKELLGSVDLKSANARQLLLQAVADRFGIDAGNLHIQMNADSEQRSVPMQQHDDDGDDEHDGGKPNDHGHKAEKPAAKQQLGKEHKTNERD